MENTMRIPMPKTQETARPDEDALDAVSEAFLSTSAVFGKSNREFEREFKEYKAAELFRRIECDLTGVLGDAELELKCAEATEKGLGGVTVLPQYVNKAKKVLRGKRTAVVAAISYPYGEEMTDTTVKAAKKAIAGGADALLVPVGTALVKRGDYQALAKQFKKLVKTAGIISLTAAIECGSLTAEETEKTVKCLKEAGIRSFRTSTGYRENGDEYRNIACIRAAYGSDCKITAFGDVQKEGTAVNLLVKADRLASRSASELVAEIKSKINIQ